MKQKPLLVALTCLALSSTAFAQGGGGGGAGGGGAGAAGAGGAASAGSSGSGSTGSAATTGTSAAGNANTGVSNPSATHATPNKSTNYFNPGAPAANLATQNGQSGISTSNNNGQRGQAAAPTDPTTHRFPRPILKIRPKQPSQPSKTPLFQEAKLPLPHPVPSARQASGSAMPQTVYRLALQVLGSDHQSNRLAKNRSSLLFSKSRTPAKLTGVFVMTMKGVNRPEGVDVGRGRRYSTCYVPQANHFSGLVCARLYNLCDVVADRPSSRNRLRKYRALPRLWPAWHTLCHGLPSTLRTRRNFNPGRRKRARIAAASDARSARPHR